MNINQKMDFYCNLKSWGAHYIGKYIAYHASPVIKGIKPAELIIIKGANENCLKIWENEKQHIISLLDLDFIEICRKKNSLTVFVYDKQLLQQNLKQNRAEAQDILNKAGYRPEWEFSKMIIHLHKRLLEMEFPHEIGLFLGYPPKDVKGFIDNKGKGFIMCKYWKVYYNAQFAEEKFRLIDEARNKAILILNNCLDYEQAVSELKAV